MACLLELQHCCMRRDTHCDPNLLMLLQDLLKLLVKRFEGTEEDKVVLDLQMSLAAITLITLERVNDEVPAGCRLLLVTQVRLYTLYRHCCRSLLKACSVLGSFQYSCWLLLLGSSSRHVTTPDVTLLRHDCFLLPLVLREQKIVLQEFLLQVRKLLQQSKLCSALDKHKDRVFTAMQKDNQPDKKKALTAQKQQLEERLSRWTDIRSEE